MSDSDEDLVLRSQRGERPAFEELVRRTARLVFSRVYLELPDAHRAEDLVQEAFLSAWRRIRQVTDPKGFRPWLLTVAHSTVVDAQRRDSRKKRSGRRAGPEALSSIPSAGPGPLAQAESEESRQRVLSVLRSLPDDYRQVLMLRYIAGADYDSIGRQLGLTNGSLRGLLQRGMEMMRRELTRDSSA